MNHAAETADRMGAAVRSRPMIEEGTEFRGSWDVVCRDKYGNLKWRDTIENIVVNAGINYALDAALSGGSPITSWYLGLLSASPTVAAGDTMASHSGWTEVTAYDEAAHQAWTDGGVSSQSVSNSGSVATFTISTDSTDVGGAYLTSASAKSASTGTLYAAGAFTAGNKSLDDGDSLEVTATFTGAAA